MAFALSPRAPPTAALVLATGGALPVRAGTLAGNAVLAVHAGTTGDLYEVLTPGGRVPLSVLALSGLFLLTAETEVSLYLVEDDGTILVCEPVAASCTDTINLVDTGIVLPNGPCNIVVNVTAVTQMITIDLPPAPFLGQTVQVNNPDNTLALFGFLINPGAGGQTIGRLPSYSFLGNGASATFEWTGSRWVITSSTDTGITSPALLALMATATVWLNGDTGATKSQWTDQTAHGNNATQATAANQPLPTSFPLFAAKSATPHFAMAFTGGSVGSRNDPLTSMALPAINAQAGSTIWQFAGDPATIARGVGASFFAGPISDIIYLNFNPPPIVWGIQQGAQIKSAHSAIRSRNLAVRITDIVHVELRSDGVSETSAAGFAFSNLGSALIGIDTAGGYFQGYEYETATWAATLLNDAQMQRVERYGYEKYGAPLVFFDGNSLTQGGGSTLGNVPASPPASPNTVTNATNTTPIVFTMSAPHDMTNGQQVTVVDVTGNTAANDTFYIEVTGPDSFVARGTAGNGAYTGGGTAAGRYTGTYASMTQENVSEPVNIINNGISGQTTPQMTLQAPGFTDTCLQPPPGNLFNIVVFFEGINDMGSGSTPAQAYAHLVTYGQARKAAGWQWVVICTLPSNVNDAQRDALNALILADFDSNGLALPGNTYADAVANVASDPLVGQDGDFSNPTYFVDGLHMTSAGYARFALYTTKAVNQGLTILNAT